jgi:ubiquinone/menaquinone biosynthesis C-methylase UbiE
MPLDDNSIDGALMAFVLQEANSPRALLKEAKRCLRNTGWLAVLEWHKREMEEGPPVKQRVEEEKVLSMATKLGFRFTARRDIDEKQYLLLMRK